MALYGFLRFLRFLLQEGDKHFLNSRNPLNFHDFLNLKKTVTLLKKKYRKLFRSWKLHEAIHELIETMVLKLFAFPEIKYTKYIHCHCRSYFSSFYNLMKNCELFTFASRAVQTYWKAHVQNRKVITFKVETTSQTEWNTLCVHRGWSVTSPNPIANM